MSEVNETLELVKEAQKQGTFNLSEVIKGRGYPQKSVTVYTDAEAAFNLIELEKKMLKLDQSSQEHKDLEALANSLAEAVQKSKLIFHMRGVSQIVVDAADAEATKNFPLVEGDRSDEWYRNYMAYLVASNIVKVENANGDVDERVFSVKDVEEIRDLIPVDSWAMLMSTMQQLTLATGYFRGMTNADFLPKS